MKTLSTLALLFVLLCANAQMVTFNYTGTSQYFVVPASVTSVNVDVRGAPGGIATNLTQAPQVANGGLGGRVQAAITVTPLDTLWIYVGGIGLSSNGTLTCFTATGGWNGGGTGYSGYNSFNYNSSGGGGASDIRIGASACLYDRAVGERHRALCVAPHSSGRFRAGGDVGGDCHTGFGRSAGRSTGFRGGAETG